jgi:hypothetical protein
MEESLEQKMDEKLSRVMTTLAEMKLMMEQPQSV